MSPYAIAATTVGAITLAATIVLLFVSPWLSLLVVIAGALVRREVAALEDDAREAEEIAALLDRLDSEREPKLIDGGSFRD